MRFFLLSLRCEESCCDFESVFPGGGKDFGCGFVVMYVARGHDAAYV
jgi:hypothetical protein